MKIYMLAESMFVSLVKLAILGELYKLQVLLHCINYSKCVLV